MREKGCLRSAALTLATMDAAAMAALFPSLIPDGSLLRAHGIVVLKYNSSQPQTDVHVDPALVSRPTTASSRRVTAP